MKKAKFALTAVAVLAIAGGAFAVKSHRNALVFVADSAVAATTPLPNYTIGQPGDAGAVQTFATEVSGDIAVYTYVAPKD